MPTNARRRVEQELFLRSFMPVNPSSAVMSQMIALMRDVYYQPGEVIYSAGQVASHLHFIVSGQVQLRAPGKQPWLLDAGSVIGIVDAMQERDYTRAAVAVRPTHIITQAFSDYLDVLEDNFDVALQTLQVAVTQGDELAARLGGAHVFTCLDVGEATSVGQRQGDRGALSHLLLLRSTPIFRRSPVQALAQLAKLGHVQQRAKGAQLFRTGERNDAVHVLAQGRVRLWRSDLGVAATVAPPRVVGGLRSVSHETRYCDAEATTDVTLLVLPRDDLLDVMEDHFGLVRSLFAAVASEREQLMHAAAERAAPLSRA